MSATTSTPVLAPTLSSEEPSRGLESPRIPRPVLEVVEDEEEESEAVGVSPTTTTATTTTIPNEPTTAPPAPATTANEGVTTGGGTNGFDASGRLNWWRAYRFPAVASAGATHAGGGGADGVPAAARTRSGPFATATATATATGSSSRTGIPATSSSDVIPPFSPLSSFSSSMDPSSHTHHQDNTTGPTNTTPLPASHSTTSATTTNVNETTANSNSVVPVIIVGLQSVNAPNWRPLMGLEGDDLWDHNHPHPRHHQHHHHNPHLRFNHNHNHSRLDRHRRRRSGFSDLIHRREEGEEEDMFVMREEEEENEDEDEDEDGNEDEIGREREEEMMMGIDDLHIEDDDGSSFYETHSRGPRRLRERERERERERRGWRNAFGGLRSGAGSSGSGSGSFGREGQSASSSSGGEGGYNRREQPATMNVPPSPMGGPGSRTFLIYVIGGKYPPLCFSLIVYEIDLFYIGYYPPDHSIVTGGPDNLESFEALLYVFFSFPSLIRLFQQRNFLGNLLKCWEVLKLRQRRKMISKNRDWR